MYLGIYTYIALGVELVTFPPKGRALIERMSPSSGCD